MDGASDFQLYLRFTKPLVFALPKLQDRALAASWIKKLIEVDAPQEVKAQYLQLLLFVMQRKRLGGIFLTDPSGLTALDPFKETNLIDVARKLVEQENVDRIKDEGAFPTIVSDYSPDLLEYVAVQEIPNFGVHAYYAIGKEPISKWNNFDNAILPRITDSMIDMGDSPKAEPSIKGFHPPPKKEKIKVDPPIAPLGRIQREEDSRVPPTWGSNLLQVKEDFREDGSPIRKAQTSAVDVLTEYQEFKDIIEEFSELDEDSSQSTGKEPQSPSCTCPPPSAASSPKDKDVSLLFDRAISATFGKSGDPSILQTLSPIKTVSHNTSQLSSQRQLPEPQMKRLSALFDASASNSVLPDTDHIIPVSRSKNELLDVARTKTMLENTSPAFGNHPLTIPRPYPTPTRPGLTPSTPRLLNQNISMPIASSSRACNCNDNSYAPM